jgi:hypothetical protein
LFDIFTAILNTEATGVEEVARNYSVLKQQSVKAV